MTTRTRKRKVENRVELTTTRGLAVAVVSWTILLDCPSMVDDGRVDDGPVDRAKRLLAHHGNGATT